MTMTPTEKNFSSDPSNQELQPENVEKLVQEFAHLLEKSKQLFNGLRFVSNHQYCSISKLIEFSFTYRDLPQYGHKQWQPYFGRTFDVYTRLWKFQQQHRYENIFS